MNPTKYLNPIRIKAVNCFNNQKRRCYTKTNPRYKDNGAKGIRVEYTRQEFIDWFISEYPKFNGEKPSVGRIDHSKSYSLNNIRFESTSDNSMERILRVGTTRERRAIHIIEHETQSIVKTVGSLTEAARETGVHASHITRYCNGKLKVSKTGFTFRYVDEKQWDGKNV